MNIDGLRGIGDALNGLGFQFLLIALDNQGRSVLVLSLRHPRESRGSMLMERVSLPGKQRCLSQPWIPCFRGDDGNKNEH